MADDKKPDNAPTKTTSKADGDTRLVVPDGFVLMCFEGPPDEGMNAMLGRPVAKGHIYTVPLKKAAALIDSKQPFDLAYADDRRLIEADLKKLRNKQSA